MKIYEAIISSQLTLDKSEDEERLEQAEEQLEKIEKMLPHGSGFDNGTKIVEATRQRIVFETSFHHMDENGYYCGWTEHRVIIKADLLYGYVVQVSGVNKRGIKEYIRDVFYALMVREFDLD